MKNLRDNRELYDYLCSLSKELKQRGADTLVTVVARAVGNAGCISTEFLGESLIALRQVLKDGHNVLNEEERADLSDVLRQLDHALDSRR